MSAKLSKSSARDVAWVRIFEELSLIDKIETEGFVDVPAKTLKNYFEPRLLAKIDHERNLPDVFRTSDIRILPLSMETYRLGRFEIFHPISAASEAGHLGQSRQIPSFVESFDAASITSEQTAIFAAVISGVLEDFLGEDALLVNSGRMRTGEFSFDILQRSGDALNVPVRNAQIEIDAGFETENSMVLIEAKNHTAVDFNIRQLYYPFRTWAKKIDKPLRSIFMTYDNKEMRIYEYDFESINNFSSIILRKTGIYTFSKSKISISDIVCLAKETSKILRLNAPFPQADNFSRVIDLVEILIDMPRELGELTVIYGFVGRQANYYSDAARYLGLVEKRAGANGRKYLYATPLAVSISKLEYRDRFLEYAKILVSVDTISKTFLRAAISNSQPNITEVREIFNSSGDSQYLSGSTIERRALTIKSWSNWLWNLASN
jgi:hypothetical protein